MAQRRMTRHRIVARTGLAALVAVAGLGACGTGASGAGAGPESGPGSARSSADGDGTITSADGELPDPVSPFSDGPAVGGLDPALRQALRQAARDAADEGIEVTVTSGWRTAEYQRSLLEDAVQNYGSRAEALRWVDTPEQSAHVTGDAVDVGPTDAAYWMSRFGARYGLCQTYSNEVWHYELATEPGGECPPKLGDAAA